MDPKDQKEVERIVAFYNQESTTYSSRRYEGETDTYTKFFFRKRLDIIISYIKNYIVSLESPSILDVGCADGIVIKKIEGKFPGKFKKIVGIDISPEMINEARKRNNSENVSFYIRGEEPQNHDFDAVMEVGFLYKPLFESEFSYAKSQLRTGGYFICSIPNKYSTQAMIKLRDKKYYEDYMSYRNYEKILRQHFTIVKKVPCGLFIPKLWSFPVLARIIQPIIDSLFIYIAPELYHEKIYLLRKEGLSSKK
ncbi:methyltransferase domain-containing protein [Candidatus Parcubacteria bacterium]|nr:methyltransferase domain-containing protein [Candidatus Parcubacteria bacterium]